MSMPHSKCAIRRAWWPALWHSHVDTESQVRRPTCREACSVAWPHHRWCMPGVLCGNARRLVTAIGCCSRHCDAVQFEALLLFCHCVSIVTEPHASTCLRAWPPRCDAAPNNFPRVLAKVAKEQPPFEVSALGHERSKGSLLKALVCFLLADAINLWNKSCIFVCVGTCAQRAPLISGRDMLCSKTFCRRRVKDGLGIITFG